MQCNNTLYFSHAHFTLVSFIFTQCSEVSRVNTINCLQPRDVGREEGKATAHRRLMSEQK